MAGLAGLILSVNPTLSAADVRQIISTTTDKINPGGYVYQALSGKPYGTWNQEVGYRRINAERALLAACDRRDGCQTTTGPCAVGLPLPDGCCVSPCDPAWRPEQQCLIGYENRFVRVPLPSQDRPLGDRYVEFRISYEDKMCLLGKQHGPLLYTVTLLPGEKVTLYHSERYRWVTSAEQRFSVQTSFMQFLSVVHEARITNTIDRLVERLSSSKSGSSGASGGGVFLGLFGFGGGSSSSSQTTVTVWCMPPSWPIAVRANPNGRRPSPSTSRCNRRKPARPAWKPRRCSWRSNVAGCCCSGESCGPSS